MNSSSFLRADGTTAAPRHHWWTNWLPTLSQVQHAIQLHFVTAPYINAPNITGPDATAANASTSQTETNVWALSMRQGMGLVVVAALLAGALPFLVNTFTAIRLGTPLPFIELARQAQGPSPSQLGEAFQTLAGLEPAFFPRGLAALLSTVGEWINWPLRWLTWWLVYGTATLLAAKVWGAPTTLQRFLAVTSYAAVPMILTGLGPIPCLGFIAQVIAVGWMAAVYATSVRAATGLDWGRTALAILLPAAVLSVVGFVVLLAATSTVLRMLF